jgi:hypothetical protein
MLPGTAGPFGIRTRATPITTPASAPLHPPCCVTVLGS